MSTFERLRARPAVCLLAAGAVASFGLMEGSALAAAGGTVRACANKKTGALRLAIRCKKGESAVTWNAQGVPGASGPKGGTGAAGSNGAAGAKGDTGAAGTNGASGTNGTNGTNGNNGATKVVVRDAQMTTAFSHNGAATVNCLPGEVATGGGWNLVSGNIASFLVFGDQPLNGSGNSAAAGDTPVGWEVSVYNNNVSGSVSWRVYVICASP
jgi:hypothetical protein